MEAPEPTVRAAAAVAIGELWKRDCSALPTCPELLDELARCDAKHPGVADAFLATVVHAFGQRELVAPWALRVLEARRAAKPEGAPVSGDAVTFHVHEWFAADARALGSLLSWGYDGLVKMALDHAALSRDDDVALLERLCTEYGHSDVATALVTRYGIWRPEVLSKCAETDVNYVPATVLARAYGARSQWAVRWIFFRQAPFPLPRSREDGATMLGRLRANALLPGDVEGEIVRPEIAHIPFPTIVGATRRSFTPRRDVALNLAVRAPTNEVLALRVVRAKKGDATVHSLGRKRTP